ncbi:phage tail tape measure protein [Halomarina litorea]|uniref:phage tail tape measure protein n=1 Tax=Halomarina litorea TaxID=2961595 RepID=UPI0020C467F6|nr:phage tail tape measure protein [Halomarina sp. BCD28]
MAITAERLQVEISSSGAGEVSGALASVKSAALDLRKAVGLMGGAVAAASGVLAGVGVNAARKFQDALVEVEKVTSAETAARMSEEVKRLAGTIPLAQSEIADLVAQAGRFGVAEDQLVGFTETVAKMATATDLAATEAGEAFAKLATITDTPISKIENLGSAINALSNNFATSSSEIVTSMMESASSLSTLGASQVEIAGLSAALNEVTSNASKAGRGLRRIAQEMLDPRKVADISRALGVSVDQFKQMRSEAPVATIKRLAQTMAGSGKQADLLRKTLTSFSRTALSNLAKNLEGVNSAVELSGKQFENATSLQREFEAQSKTFNNQAQLLANQLRNVAITIGEALLPGLTDFVSKLTSVTKGVSQWVQSLSDAQIRLGLLAGQVGGIITALTALNPVLGLVASGVVALAAAWRSDFGGIQAATREVLQVIRSEFAPSVRYAMALVRDITSTVAGAFRSELNSMGITARSVVQTIKTVLIGGIRTLGGSVRGALTVIGAAWHEHRATVVATVRTLVRTARSALGQLEALFDRFAPKIQAVADRFGGWKTVLLGLAPVLLGLLGPVGTLIGASGLGGLVSVATTAGGIFATLASTLGSVALTLGTVSSSVTKTLLSFGKMRTILTALVDKALLYGVYGILKFKDALGVLKGFLLGIPGIISSVVSSVSSFSLSLTSITGAVPVVTGGIRAILAAVMGLSAPLAAAGLAAAALYAAWKNNFGGIRDTTRQVLSGVKALLRGDTSKMRTLVANGVQRMRDAWDRLQVLYERAKAIFEHVKAVVMGAMTWLWQNAITPVLNSIEKQWKTHGQALYSEILETYQAIKSRITQFVDFIWPFIEGFLGATESAWQAWGDEILVIVRFLFDTVGSVINTAVDFILTVVRTGLNILQGDWEEAWNAIAGFLERTFGGIRNFVENWVGGFVSWFDRTFIQPVIQFFEDLHSQIIGNSIVPEMFNAISSFVDGWISGFLGTIGSFGRDLISDVSGFLGDVVGAFQDKLGAVEDIASDIVGAASDAASDAADYLSDAKGAAADAASAAADAAGSAADAVGDAINAGANAIGLASGGVVSGATRAVVGEGRSKEAVIPLNDRGVGAMARAMEAANVQTSGGGGSGGVTIGRVEVNANSRSEGRAAGRGFVDELRSANFNNG